MAIDREIIYERVRYEAAVVALREEAKDVREVGSNNRGPQIDKYKLRAHSPLSANHQWCGFFVFYCLSEAANAYSVPLPFIPEKLWSGYKLTKWANEHPEHVVTEGPYLPGDFYVIHENGHIGLITSQGPGNIVNTVDGNQSVVGGGRSLKQRQRCTLDMRVILRIAPPEEGYVTY